MTRPFPTRASRRVALLLASALPLLADNDNNNNNNNNPVEQQQQQQELRADEAAAAAVDLTEQEEPQHKNITSAAAGQEQQQQLTGRGRIRQQREENNNNGGGDECDNDYETEFFYNYLQHHHTVMRTTTPIPPYAPLHQQEEDLLSWLWSSGGGVNDDDFHGLLSTQCWNKKRRRNNKISRDRDSTCWRVDNGTCTAIIGNNANGVCPVLTNQSTNIAGEKGSDEHQPGGATGEVPPGEEGTVNATAVVTSNATDSTTNTASDPNATAEASSTEEPTAVSSSPTPSPTSAASTILSVDYASKSAGALVLDKSSEFSGTSNLLTNDKDRYAIVPCSESRKHVVIGLSEDLLVKRVVLAAYERYSSHVETFQLLGSSASTKATDNDIILNASDDPEQQQQQAMSAGGGSGGVWVDLGTYKAKFAQQGEQVFDLEKPAWARYLQFRLLSFYGDEHYCTLSQVKVHGSTVLQGFHEQWTQQEQQHEETNNNSNNDEVGGGEEAVTNNSQGGETAEEGVAPEEETAAGDAAQFSETGGNDVDLDVDEDASGRKEGGGPVIETEDELPPEEGAPVTADSVAASATLATSNACGCGGLLAKSVLAGGNLDLKNLMLQYSSSGSACLSPECSSYFYSSVGISSSSQSINPDYYVKKSEKDPTGPSFTVNDIVESLPSTTELTAPIIEKIQGIKNRFLASTADEQSDENVTTNDETSAEGADLDDSENEKKKEVSAGGGGEKDPTAPVAEQKAHQAQPKPHQQQQQQQQQQPRGQGQPQKTEEVVGASSEESSEDEPPTAATKSTTTPTPPVSSSPSSSSSSDTPADHSSTKDESIQRTSEKLARLLERLPSAACLGKLDFDTLVNQKINKNGGQGLGNPAAMMGGAVEPVFKKLTDEIKALQASVAVHDQFTRESVACYQRVLFDLFLEMESIRIDHGARLEKLETGREVLTVVLQRLGAINDWLLPRISYILSALWSFIALVITEDLGVFVRVAALTVAVLVIASVYHVLERFLFYKKKRRHNREESTSSSCVPSSPPPSSPPVELNIKKPMIAKGCNDDNHHKIASTVATVESCEVTSDDGSLLSEEDKAYHHNEPGKEDSSYILSSVVKPRSKAKLPKKTSPQNKSKGKRRS